MFLYESHLHTAQGSACARTPGRDYIDFYRAHGYAGLVVTDHFFRGNCAVDRSLPWAEFVRRFASGYEDARAEGERKDFDVFFGWEERFDGDEFLVIGLDAGWLTAHPDIVAWPREEYLRRVREAGGALIQAHPFRQRRYITAIHLCGAMADAVETANLHNAREEDALAAAYAARLGKPATAGNDMHEANPAHPPEMGLLFPGRLRDVRELAEALRGGGGFTAVVPEGRHVLRGTESTALPVYEYDAKGRRRASQGGGV